MTPIFCQPETKPELSSAKMSKDQNFQNFQNLLFRYKTHLKAPQGLFGNIQHYFSHKYLFVSDFELLASFVKQAQNQIFRKKKDFI